MTRKLLHRITVAVLVVLAVVSAELGVLTCNGYSEFVGGDVMAVRNEGDTAWGAAVSMNNMGIWHFEAVDVDHQDERLSLGYDWCGFSRGTAAEYVHTPSGCPILIRRVHVSLWLLSTLFGVYPVIALVRHPARKRRRRRKLGQCVKCGYDLTGNESGKCPECGSGVAA